MEIRKACVVFGNPDLRQLIWEHRACAIAHDVLLELVALDRVHSECKEILMTDWTEIAEQYRRHALWTSVDKPRADTMYQRGKAFEHQMRRIRNLQGISFGILAAAASCSTELGYPVMLRILRRQGPAERMLFERYREWVNHARADGKFIQDQYKTLREMHVAVELRRRQYLTPHVRL
tara:strand:- start:115 stop:648 length:534 start_codon:yes stop_codon:yes gene_type:complete